MQPVKEGGAFIFFCESFNVAPEVNVEMKEKAKSILKNDMQ